MTTRHPPLFYLPLWESADAEEIGVKIKVNPDHQAKLVNTLYACKQEAGGFDSLMIFQPQPPGTIFIAHKTVELPE